MEEERSRKRVRKTWKEEDDNNKDVVIREIRKYGNLLQFASREMCIDEEVVIEAVKRAGDSYQYIQSEVLRNRRDIVKYSVSSNGNSLRFMDEGWKSDLEVVKLATLSTGHALQHCIPELKANHEIVLKAMKNYLLALKEYASPKLRKCEIFMTKAIKQNPQSLKYADPHLHNSKEFYRNISSHFSDSDLEILFTYAEKEVLEDEELFHKLIDRNGVILQYAPTILQSDESFVLRAIETYPKSIQWSDLSHSNKSVALKVVEKDPKCLEYFGNPLRNDLEICHVACLGEEGDPFSCFQFCGEKVKNNEDFVVKVLRRDNRVLFHLGLEFQKNLEILKVACTVKRRRKKAKIDLKMLKYVDFTQIQRELGLEGYKNFLLRLIRDPLFGCRSMRHVHPRFKGEEFQEVYLECFRRDASVSYGEVFSLFDIMNFITRKEILVEAIDKSVTCENIIEIIRIFTSHVDYVFQIRESHKDVGLIALKSYIKKHEKQYGENDDNKNLETYKISTLFSLIQKIFVWDREMNLKAIRIEGSLLKFFEGSMDREMIMEAVKQNKNAIKNVPLHFSENYSFLDELVDWFDQETINILFSRKTKKSSKSNHKEWIDWFKMYFWVFKRKSKKSLVGEAQLLRILESYFYALRRCGWRQNERDLKEREEYLSDKNERFSGLFRIGFLGDCEGGMIYIPKSVMNL